MSATLLSRAFGFWTGAFVIAASMVGSGILTNSGPILRMTGSYPILFSLWMLGGFLALLGAATLAELASGLPRVGGDYVFVREAFGPAWGFVYGWSMVLVGFAAPVAMVAFTAASYLTPLLPAGLLFAGRESILATTLICVFTLIHCSGSHRSAGLQNLTTVFKVSVLLLVSVAGVFVAPSYHYAAGIGASASLPVSFGSLASGLVLVMYAYSGWNGAVYLSGEIRDPHRNIPRALFWGTFGVAALYLVVNLFYGAALSVDRVREMSDADLARFAEVAAESIFGGAFARIFSLLVGLGVLASLSAFILTGPRILFAMAEDGLIFSKLGSVSSATGAPVAATLAQSVMAIGFLWSGTFEAVLTYTGFGLGVLGTFVVAPIFVLRRRSNFLPQVRVPGYPWTPALFLFVSFAMLAGAFWEAPVPSILSLATIAIGFPVYLAWKYWRSE